MHSGKILRVATLVTQVLAAVSFASHPGYAAELIKVPNGVVVRSLFDWEQASGLEISLGSNVQTASSTALGSDFKFSKQALCDSAAYRLIKSSAAGAFVDLRHLCQDEQADAVTFALIADTQELHAEHETTAELLAELASTHPDIKFVINAGDIVDDSTDAQWRAYRAIAAKHYSSYLPLVPVIGNHEYFNDPEIKRWQQVYGTDQTKRGFYALDLGPAVLIVLNSSIDRMPASEKDAQTAWLEQTLAAYSTQKPMLVTYHHPAYATGIANIFMPVPPRYIKEHWLPLFARYGVKMVMNGHEHVYERLLIDGVRYLNAGPAGGKHGRVKPFETAYTELVLKKTRTISIVTVRGNGDVSLKTYSPDKDGDLVDELDF